MSVITLPENILNHRIMQSCIPGLLLLKNDVMHCEVCFLLLIIIRFVIAYSTFLVTCPVTSDKTPIANYFLLTANPINEISSTIIGLAVSKK